MVVFSISITKKLAFSGKHYLLHFKPQRGVIFVEKDVEHENRAP
jgi:hypothetical protein